MKNNKDIFESRVFDRIYLLREILVKPIATIATRRPVLHCSYILRGKV